MTNIKFFFRLINEIKGITFYGIRVDGRIITRLLMTGKDE